MSNKVDKLTLFSISGTEMKILQISLIYFIVLMVEQVKVKLFY